MEWLSLCVQRTSLRGGLSPPDSQHTLLGQWDAENLTPRTTQHFELVAITAGVLWGYLDEALGVRTLLKNVKDSPFPCGSVHRQWAAHLRTGPIFALRVAHSGMNTLLKTMCGMVLKTC